MKKREKILLLGGVILSGLIASNPSDIYASNGYAGGSGTQSDPYLISTPEHLNQVRLDVADSSGKYYKVVNDIDLSGFDSDNDASNGNWTPIGTEAVPFKGNFDGNGHIVKSMVINLPSTRRIGLFGSASGSSTLIRNLGVIDADVIGGVHTGIFIGENTKSSRVEKVYTSGTVSGSEQAGGVIGINQGGASISKSFSTATVSGRSSSLSDAGGFAGVNYDGGTIRECFAAGDVTGVGDNVGGFIGRNTVSAYIYDSYATGNASSTRYVGGFVGKNFNGAGVYRSFAVGVPSSTSSAPGGLAGYNSGSSSQSYWDKETSGVTYTATGTGLTTQQMIGSNAATNMSGFDFSTVWKTQENDYPTLRWNTSSAPVIEARDVEIFKGDSFDALNFATVTDDFDRNLTLEVKEDTVKPSIPGIYTVTYYAKDAHGNETTKTITVKVKSKPVITISDIDLKVGDDFEPLDYVTVTDEYDKNIKITSVENLVKTSKPGTYSVTYKAVNSFGVEVVEKVEVLVKSVPVISAKTNDVLVMVGDKFNALDYVKATDEVDGDVVVVIVGNEVDTSNPGLYTVTYSATNNMGVETIFTLEVKVSSEPVINIPSTKINVKLGSVFNAKDFVTASDDYDGELEVKVIDSNVNPKKAGVYTVTYQAENSFGVKAVRSVAVIVYDNITVFPDLKPQEGVSGGNSSNNSTNKPNNGNTIENNDEKNPDKNNSAVEGQDDSSNDKENNSNGGENDSTNKNEQNKNDSSNSNVPETGVSSLFMTIIGGVSLLLGAFSLLSNGLKKNK